MNNQFITTQASIQGKYPRSRFDIPFNHKTSFNAGELVPLSCTEILPGDTITLDAHSLVRMTTPIAPIMDNIKQDIFYFFVPRRLLETDWEKFITYSDWSKLNTASVRTCSFFGGPGPYVVDRHSLGSYFGLPIGGYTSAQIPGIIAAPFAGYGLIWNEYFRDENYQSKINFSGTIGFAPGVSDVVNGEINSIYVNGRCAPVNEFHDVYTSVLPSPQKGPQVLLPLGDTAPVFLKSTDPVNSSSSYSLGVFGNAVSFNNEWTLSDEETVLYNVGDNAPETTGSIYVDLSKAVAASVNDLRESILVQHFLEQLGRTGSRMQEYLLGFFGVISPDARLQRPEFITKVRFNINVSEVLQTAGYNAESDTTLGSTGAVARVGNSSNGVLTYSATEHGYLYALTCVRHDLTYSQGMPKMFTKKKALDYYVPVLNGLGEQPVLSQEVLYPVSFNSEIMKEEFSNAGSSVGDSILGYNEPWYEYRHRPNISSGMLNPVAKDGLDYWTLTKAFTTATITGADIRVSNPDTLDRALTISHDLCDQFVIDYFEDAKITRVMPVRSIPGINKL